MLLPTTSLIAGVDGSVEMDLCLMKDLKELKVLAGFIFDLSIVFISLYGVPGCLIKVLGSWNKLK